MHTNDALPIVLISAKNIASVHKVVSALIENEVCSSANSLNGEEWMWHIVNKYYRADVRVLPFVDGETPSTHLSDLVEAHVIYLNDDENEECAEYRFIHVGDHSRVSQVRLVLSEKPESPALAAWATRRRYELVPLQMHSDSEDENDDDIRGIPRARAAIHAHTWRGLVRLDKPNAPLPATEDTLESDGESCDSWGSWQGEGAGESPGGDAAQGAGAEVFASMLSTLAAERAALAALADSERRRRAEALLCAFTAALAPPRRN
ncbi:uncharacterized protein LOC119829416 [Zerene cesonia]|uniref:uncharacterized protein LOC119829416 n=1 Tax=Zerene cesonia TaxID=33412 RepID=UPI0018E5243A|nr:uncharacterized protein LOC119829416 [Zerene cesonia]